jgi:hypothetical protein
MDLCAGPRCGAHLWQLTAGRVCSGQWSGADGPQPLGVRASACCALLAVLCKPAVLCKQCLFLQSGDDDYKQSPSDCRFCVPYRLIPSGHTVNEGTSVHALHQSKYLLAWQH